MYESVCQTEEEKKNSLYSIGSRIRRFRRKAKLTQPQLASLVDIDGRTLSFYENGSREMGANRLFQIAAALHVGADDLAPEWMMHKDEQAEEKGQGMTREMDREMSDMFVEMSAGQKAQVLEFARFILREKGRYKVEGFGMYVSIKVECLPQKDVCMCIIYKKYQ